MGLCGGGGGGDGGASERKAAEDGRQQSAIQRLNRAFGYGREARPQQGQFLKTVGRNAQQVAQDTFFADFANRENDNYRGANIAVTEDVADEDAFKAAAAVYDAESAQPSALDRRKALYGKFAADAEALQMSDLGKQRDVATRETGFDLARRGLSGGSRQIDSDRDITDQFQKGTLQARTQSQGIANSAEQADEKTRINLINGIRGGMDEADAISGAMNAMSSNAANAQNQAQQQEIGGFFDEIRAQAQQRQQAEQYQQGFDKYRNGSKGGAGANGTVQSFG